MTKRVLVVDDDENTRDAYSLVLESEGHEVDGCQSGEEALEQLRAQPYDVLVTDQVMPGMSGLELARAAHALDAHLRCVVVSGYAAPPADIRTDVAWLKKPVDVKTLIDSVEKGCSHPRAG